MNIPTDNITKFEDYCRLSVDFKKWYTDMGKDASNGNASFNRIVLPITRKIRQYNKILGLIGWEIKLVKTDSAEARHGS